VCPSAASKPDVETGGRNDTLQDGYERLCTQVGKETNELEIWKRTAAGGFKHFKTYEICAYSGTYGPKIKEGDRQSPEGIYNITPGLMNPNSNYYLSFDTGFPNKFDRAWAAPVRI